MKEVQSTLTIYYPRQRGCIMEAHKLQQKIRANFDLSVAIKEHKEKGFALILNGATIYSEDISDCTLIDHITMLGVIGTHERPLGKIGEKASEYLEESNDDDPDHLQWLNSVCSGE